MPVSKFHLNPITLSLKNCSSFDCLFPIHLETRKEYLNFIKDLDKSNIAGKYLKDVLPDFLNNWLIPENVLAQYSKPIELICPLGHVNNVAPKRFIEKLVCDECFGFNRSICKQPYFNEFSSLNNMNPEKVSSLEKKFKIIWECRNKHSFEQTPWHRTIKNWGCSVCSKKKKVAGVNTLEVTNPEALTEWDFAKNSLLNIYPNEVTSGTKVQVWWTCEKFNHSWLARICDRFSSSNSGCHFCAGSKMENDFGLFLEDILKELINCNSINSDFKKVPLIIRNDRKILKGQELDFYLPELDIAIEFNGKYFHSDSFIKENYDLSAREYHLNKFNKCKELGINLVFVWEQDWISYRSELKNSLVSLLNATDENSDYSFLSKLQYPL